MNRLQALRSGLAASPVVARATGVVDGSTMLQDGLGAMWQTWAPGGKDVEAITHDFASYCRAGYKQNGIVFAVVLARMALFSEGVFAFRNRQTKKVYTTDALEILEKPWPNGSTRELLARMEQDASLGGNFYGRRVGPRRLERLRPDLVDILLAVVPMSGWEVKEVVGYVYHSRGRATREGREFMFVEDMVHWAPIPDPEASYRGMSWLTPVVREINADQLMTEHKGRFFKNAATPNAWVKVQGILKDDQRERLRAEMELRYGGVENAHKTLILDAGADYTTIGHSFEQMQFATVQAAGENRIAAAGGVPGIVAGLKEGLDAATYSNYAQAMRRFADLFGRPNWASAAEALETVVVVPSDSRLIVDSSDVAAMKEGEKDRAEIFKIKAESAGNLIRAGYKPESVQAAVAAGDLAQLEHTGNIPVTLYDPNKAEPGRAAQAPEDGGS